MNITKNIFALTTLIVTATVANAQPSNTVVTPIFETQEICEAYVEPVSEMIAAELKTKGITTEVETICAASDALDQYNLVSYYSGNVHLNQTNFLNSSEILEVVFYRIEEKSSFPVQFLKVPLQRIYEDLESKEGCEKALAEFKLYGDQDWSRLPNFQHETPLYNQLKCVEAAEGSFKLFGLIFS